MLKIHILGGPGSGKTTLARELSTRLQIPHYDLDQLGWKYGDATGPYIEEALAIAGQPGWVTEGIYLFWIDPLLDRADFIVLVEVSWLVAAWRILRRHLVLSLRRANPYPTRLMPPFLRFTRSYYASRECSEAPTAEIARAFLAEQRAAGDSASADTLLRRFEKYRKAIPCTAEFTRLYLERYQNKVIRVRNDADRARVVEGVIKRVSRECKQG